MRCAKTLGNGCRGPTGRALRQPTPVELVTCEWPPGLRPSWPPYPPARATGAVAATTFSLSAGLPKQHEQDATNNDQPEQSSHWSDQCFAKRGSANPWLVSFCALLSASPGAPIYVCLWPDGERFAPGSVLRHRHDFS